MNIATAMNAIRADCRRDNRVKVKETKVRLSRTLRNMMTPPITACQYVFQLNWTVTGNGGCHRIKGNYGHHDCGYPGLFNSCKSNFLQIGHKGYAQRTYRLCL